MKEKLQKILENGGWGLQKLFDKDNDGGCPCFSGKFKLGGKICEVQGRCWRVSEKGQDLHIYCHNNEIIKLIKECLDAQEWYQKYTIIKHRKPFLGR